MLEICSWREEERRGMSCRESRRDFRGWNLLHLQILVNLSQAEQSEGSVNNDLCRRIGQHFLGTGLLISIVHTANGGRVIVALPHSFFDRRWRRGPSSSEKTDQQRCAVRMSAVRPLVLQVSGDPYPFHMTMFLSDFFVVPPQLSDAPASADSVLS